MSYTSFPTLWKLAFWKWMYWILFQIPDTSGLPPDSVIFNFSDRILSTHEKQVLALGLQFSLPIKHPNFYKHFLCCEKFFNKLSDKEMLVPAGNSQPPFKHSFKNLCLTAYYSFKCQRDNTISPEQWSGLKSLKEDKSIIITKLDKGNGVVLLNKVDYIQKMNLILQDNQTFSCLNTNLFFCSSKKWR